MGIGGALVGGLLQSKSASKAAKAQTQAADRQIDYQEETRDIVRGDLAPWREGGQLAQGALMNMLGLGAAPMIGGANRTGGTEWGGWQTDPGYEFRLGEGQRAIEASAAARGGLNSGATMRDLQKYGQDYGSAEFGNVWNRLAGVSGAGMGAAQMSGNASMQTAGNVGNALGAIGNAQAAGAIGQGNAWGNALTNIYGIQNYQKQMGSQTGGTDRNSFGNQLLGNSGWF